MRKNQYSLKLLLIATFVTAVTSWLVMVVRDQQTVIDFTKRQSVICEVHGCHMKKRLVGMLHGMPMPNPNGDPEADARRSSFPHAEEPYRTGYCCPTSQTNARVYVCSQCSLARDAWTKANTSH